MASPRTTPAVSGSEPVTVMHRNFMVFRFRADSLLLRSKRLLSIIRRIVMAVSVLLTSSCHLKRSSWMALIRIWEPPLCKCSPNPLSAVQMSNESESLLESQARRTSSTLTTWAGIRQGLTRETTVNPNPRQLMTTLTNCISTVIYVYQQQNSVYAAAAVYPREGGYVYIHVVQYPTTIFKFSCDGSGNPTFTYVGATSDSNAYILGVGHGTTTSYQDQDGTGLVWVADVQGYNLRIYSIGTNSLSLQKTFTIPAATKFGRPVFGDGKAYISTTQGLLYAFGSPVNTPLICNSPYDFGTVTTSNGSTGNTNPPATIQCMANITTTVTSITLNSKNFNLSSLPTLPLTVQAGTNFSFKAQFVSICCCNADVITTDSSHRTQQAQVLLPTLFQSILRIRSLGILLELQ